MPPGSMQYTLVGFSAELDWRPLCFLKPLPSHRVCGACGLVRKWTALLPCSHTLCESCYELSTRDGGRVCPLDGHQCEEEDVFTKEFPVQELHKREVKCWNEGCGAVFPASQIGQHFHECRHHCIRCPRCSARVLCTNVCSHLESECSTATATPAGLKCQGDSDRKDETALILTSFREILQEQAAEIKTFLEQLLVASGANGDRLNEVVHGVNSCQETLREVTEGITSAHDGIRQEVLQVRTEHRDCVKKCCDEIAARSEETKGRLIASSDTMQTICNSVNALEKVLRDELAQVARGKGDSDSEVEGSSSKGATEQVGESSSATSRMDEVVPRSPDLQASVCEFVVKRVGPLDKKSWNRSSVEYESERVYLRGYCMSPGVHFRRSYYGFFVHALFRLHKGDMDDVVQWPFNQAVRLRFVHPKEGVRVIEERPCGYLSYCQRPREGQEQRIFYSNCGIFFEDLVRYGYVESDQLRLKFELLA